MGRIKDEINGVPALCKAVLLSRRVDKRERRREGSRIIVMGNGPSLKRVIAEDFEVLMSTPRMAVNFAANAPEYNRLRPEYYVMADPHFFFGAESDPNVARLWESLRATDWDMTLWLPARYRRRLTRGGAGLLAGLPGCVKVKWFNMTPSEGCGMLTVKLIDWGLVMPRPRNVLIPAVMCAIREGYEEIVLVGADHSWLQSLWVDDKNRVVSVQPHFYADNHKELDRVAQEYAGYHLHDILQSMTVAFKSYFDIKSYSERRGVKIYNATEGSFIDAFDRCEIGQKRRQSERQ